MKRLTIAGKEKKPYDYCPSCRNGKEFGKEQYFQTDMLGNNYKEHICGQCLTKYKQPYIPLEIKVENFIAEDICLTDYKEWCLSNGSSLIKQNASYHMIKIGLFLKEERKVFKEQIEQFEKTGKCENHKFIKSHPFTTAEGRFQIDCCPICMDSKIVYKGVTYYDKVMNIVRFIAHNGIEFEKTQTLAVPDFNIETIKEIEKATQQLPDFSIAKPMPVW